MKWINKYKPTREEDLLLPASPLARKTIARLFKTGECATAGILLHDSIADGGTGKTTLVNLLIETLGWDVFTLDTTGNTMKELDDLSARLERIYGQKNELFSKPGKSIIVGHEISKSSKDYIDGLRNLMDLYNEDVLFLFTDNHFDTLCKNNSQIFKNQRILSFDFDTIPVEDIRARCLYILEQEGKNTTAGRKELETQLANKKNSIRAIVSGLETRL